MCTLEGSNSRRRGDEGRFCAVVKAAVLAAFGNSEERERGGGKKVMACNVTLCDCGLVLLRAGRVGGGEIRATGANCSLSRSVPRVKLTRDKSERCRRIGKWPRS